MQTYSLTIDEEQLDIINAALNEYIEKRGDENSATDLELVDMLDPITLDASCHNDLTA